MLPEMAKHGYDRSFATGLTVTTGLLGPIIPPSMLMIIYGVLAYQSVAALFIAGILPGLLIVSAFFVTIFLSRKRLPDTGEMPPISFAPRDIALDALPALIPATIIAGIVSGVMTPTEAGALAALVSLVISVGVFRSLKLADFLPVTKAVLLSSAATISLIAMATLLGWVLAFQGIPDLLSKGIADLSVGDR